MTSLPDNINTRGAAAVRELEQPEDLRTKVKVFGREDIQFVLPTHQGLLLLLDKVTIYPNSMVVGELTVTQERCFAFWLKAKDELILRAIDLIEMAAQLLGVWGFQFREIFKERRREFLLVSWGAGELHETIKVGERVSIEIPVEKISAREREVANREGKKIGRQFIIHGREFTIKREGKEIGATSDIVLMSTVIR